MFNNAERAQTLVEALPYIQKFYGKVVVVKYGGNAMTSHELFDAVMEDLILLRLVGIPVVLVHGGGPEIDAMLTRLGMESRFVNGLRYTDRETMEIVQSVLCGKVNKDLVATLTRLGASAVGLCGIDGELFRAVKYGGGELGYVGEITRVNPGIVLRAIDAGRIPVIATVALGEDEDTAYNVNADTAAAKLAIALGAEKLILLTNTRGVLRVFGDEDTLIPQITLAQIPELQEQNIIAGGMIPKVECCRDAIDGGVRRTHILDGRVPHSILIEMLTDSGNGTMIYDN
ncbi:MAG: acetylglutamate kinase [Oscillospiraceae bacterium]|jgi:acetylglutamate kinase|nr:acetylglutamate kinase [Oscillospiraceae bacterium]